MPSPVFTLVKYRRNTVDLGTQRSKIGALWNLKPKTDKNAYFATYNIGNIKRSYNPSYNAIMAA